MGKDERISVSAEILPHINAILKRGNDVKIKIAAGGTRIVVLEVSAKKKAEFNMNRRDD